MESVPVGPSMESLPTLPAPSLKRKREEIADSQSEDEELGSDDDFAWPNDLSHDGEVKRGDQAPIGDNGPADGEI